MTVVVAEDGHGASTDSEKRRHVTSAPRQLGLMYALPHLREAHRSLSALAVSSGRGLPPNESELPGRSQVRLRCGTRRPLIAPQPLRTLAVDRPALLEQQLVRPGGPPASAAAPRSVRPGVEARAGHIVSSRKAGHRRRRAAVTQGERVESILVQVPEQIEQCLTLGSHQRPSERGIGV